MDLLEETKQIITNNKTNDKETEFSIHIVLNYKLKDEYDKFYYSLLEKCTDKTRIKDLLIKVISFVEERISFNKIQINTLNVAIDNIKKEEKNSFLNLEILKIKLINENILLDENILIIKEKIKG